MGGVRSVALIAGCLFLASCSESTGPPIERAPLQATTAGEVETDSTDAGSTQKGTDEQRPNYIVSW
ncbi:MAG: hypothetical protein HY560_09835 [Gemmatimonadetes bacterium]|nr:hypothetical protein [Gemmatimonadota bacterium]